MTGNDIDVIVLDDDEGMAALICDVAQGLGFTAAAANDHRAFKRLYEAASPLAIFLDLHMPDVDGIQVLNELDESGCAAEVALISGYDRRVLKSAQDFGRSKNLKMERTFEKPIDVDDMEVYLRSLKGRAGEFEAAAIRQALNEQQFFVRYQPKLTLGGDDPAADRVDGAEALVRWQHPRLGEIGPDAFIPIAEGEIGVIREMTDQVLWRVASQVAAWRKQRRPMTVAVNLSSTMLTDTGLPEKFAEMVRDAGATPENLIVEITESAVMADVQVSMEIFTRLRLKGFGLSIDDFGTGYSALAKLRQMPFSELKVDKAFIGPMGQDEDARIIVHALVKMAHAMGLSVCAEGVEDHETLAELRGLGCEKIQGYLINKPLLADEFDRFIRERDT